MLKVKERSIFKIRNLIIILSFVMLFSILFTTNSNAAVDVTRNVYSNNGSMKFNFTGLTLDTTHEYEFGLTKTSAATVENWYLVTEYTENTAIVDITTTTTKLREVINAGDTGYITIKDKTDDTIALAAHSIDLKTPYLQVTNHTVINNGQTFGTSKSQSINVGLRDASNSEAYYQYEKITDQNIINKYKEIKEEDGNMLELSSILSTTVPGSNWNTWQYWNGHGNGMEGYGRPTSTINTPETGLYYLWVYFSGNNIKNMYGYILVDSLAPEIAVTSISLPETRTVEMGKTTTLTPTFNPTNATNKIVTWTSSDESVATVNNAGLVTPKKVGSAIITVTTQDGNKTATSTVTVTEPSNNNTNNNNSNSANNSNTNNNNSNLTEKDNTVSGGTLPKAGLTQVIVMALGIIVIIGTLSIVKFNKIGNIK